MRLDLLVIASRNFIIDCLHICLCSQKSEIITLLFSRKSQDAAKKILKMLLKISQDAALEYDNGKASLKGGRVPHNVWRGPDNHPR